MRTQIREKGLRKSVFGAMENVLNKVTGDGGIEAEADKTGEGGRELTEVGAETMGIDGKLKQK